VTLATLAPQGMNYEGIEECLQTPEMTRVWLDYVTAHPEEVRSPAAYIRRGVRSGNKPLVRAKREEAALPTAVVRTSRKRSAFDRMDANEYTLWPFDAGEWRQVDPSVSAEAFAAWIATHDPETVRPKCVG